MKKTAFKTFVCSFVFSLFILFSVNGLFFYAPQSLSNNIKIPSKNISLFFMGDTTHTGSAMVYPIKKITLALPVKAVVSEENIAYAPPSLPSPSAEESEKKEDIIPTKDILPVSNDIPLEIAKEDISNTREFVSEDFSRIMKMQPPVYAQKEEKEKPQPLGGSSEKNTSVKLSHHTPKETKPIKLETKDSSKGETSLQFDEHKPQSILATKEESKAIEVASLSKDLKPQASTEKEKNSPTEERELLIPLQKDINNISDNAFVVAKAADEDQIAMAPNDAPISSMIKKGKSAEFSSEKETSEPKAWKNMSEETNSDTPWVAAKSTKFPKNNTVLEADYYKEAGKTKLEVNKIINEKSQDVKLAAEMVQNILIPIPEDILKEDPLIPQLESSKDNKTAEENNNAKTDDLSLEKKDNTEKEENKQDKTDTEQDSNKGSLLKSITSLFSSDKAPTEDTTKANEEKEEDISFVDRITGKIKKKGNKPTKILPAEMRLAFQPNRAEISGTTLKWLQAFANKVKSDRSVILEVRIDGTSSYALQQKRLNLLHNILTNKGVDYHKINTVFTTREPNSFIIRTVKINNNIDEGMDENNGKSTYYQAW